MNPPRRNHAPHLINFTYKQNVESSELRLLEIVNITRENLEFRLLHAPRYRAPRYTAASYTWGDDAPSEIIKVDGQPFRVRPNLWSCLYYVGRGSMLAGRKYLWVDAICIDQQNDHERSAQVRCMAQTYRDAACVSVWLGLIPVPDMYAPLPDMYSPLLASSSSPIIKMVESDSFSWAESIHDLANRAYWSRYWVIQEFLLGKDIRLHCSDTYMDWTDFQELLCYKAGLAQCIDDHTAAVPFGDMTTPFAALPLTLARNPDKHPKFPRPLATLLVAHTKSECKDPRDRIFALLGLVTSDEQGLLGRFFPDYTMSTTVVRIVTLAHLMQWGSREDPKLLHITPSSDDIFRALGVVSKSQRRFLITQAKRLDYSLDWRHGALSGAREASDMGFQMGPNEDEGTWTEDPCAENRWVGQPNSRGAGWARLLKVVVWFSVLGAVGYYYSTRKASFHNWL